jgi:hypothetical protein
MGQSRGRGVLACSTVVHTNVTPHSAHWISKSLDMSSFEIASHKSL